MKLLTGTGLVGEIAEDTYTHTWHSMAYCKNQGVDFFLSNVDIWPSYYTLPEYFASHSAEDMANLRKTPYSYAYGNDGRTFYEIMASKKGVHEQFDRAMMAGESQMPTLGMYPFAALQNEVKGEPERVLVVDIGGGRGHSVLQIKKETQDGWGSKLVLQDLSHVVDTIVEADIPGVEKMAYDFTTPQPIKSENVLLLPRQNMS